MAKNALRFANRKTFKRVTERLTILLPYANRTTSKYFSEFLALYTNSLMLIPEIVVEKNLAELCVHHLFGSKIKVPFEIKPDKYHDFDLGYNEHTQASILQSSMFIEAFGSSFGNLFDLLWRCTGALGAEYTKFLKTESAIMTLISLTDSKFSLRCLAKFFSCLYLNDVLNSQIFINILISNIRTQDSFNKPKHFVLISYFISFHNNIESELFTSLFDVIFDLILNHPGSGEVALKYLFKIASKNSDFLNYVSNKSELDKFEDWIIANMYYTLTGSPEKFIKPIYQEYIIKLQRIRNTIKPYKENEYNSDDEIPNDMLSENLDIDVLDSTGKYWTTGKIEANLDQTL